jgi:ferrous iron transport protein B
VLFGSVAAPVLAAYLLAAGLQPRLDAAVIEPARRALAPLEDAAPLGHEMLVGDYGVLTLGWYSFLWAFPVVLLVGLSAAVTEVTGLRARVTAALDPWLRGVGLRGRDLIPVLTGFGCNVVAVVQSRACSGCTRQACVAMISFGAACSYQIGAGLSLFGASGHGWLFAPYLAALVVVGAVHTRAWYGRPVDSLLEAQSLAPLRRPDWRAVRGQLAAAAGQFVFQAMPVFFAICALGALLAHGGALARLAEIAAPALSVLGLPGEAAPGVVASIVRKDGILILNQGDGALLEALSPGQLLVLVYVASTLTGCLVTVWTVRRELGARAAAGLVARQLITSVVTAVALAALVARP